MYENMYVSPYLCICMYIMSIYACKCIPSLVWGHHLGHLPLPHELLLREYYVTTMEFYSNTNDRYTKNK